MLSLLLLHPVRERAGNRWIAIYSRTFYLALLPAIAMLFAAIGKRIGQYGITEDRYFLLVLTSWLAVMAVAYGFRRATDIRWIPITLCLVAFITYSGPWGAYSVSRNNQAARLMNLLERARVLVDGKPVTPAPEVSVAQRKEIASAISYVAGTHGMKALPKPVRLLAGSEARLKMDDRSRWQRGELVARKVMSELGIGYVDPWQTTEMHYVNYYEQPPTLAIDDIAGFRSVVSFQSNPPMKFQTPRFGLGGARRLADPCDRHESLPALAGQRPPGAL
jgi:hypothetical protein